MTIEERNFLEEQSANAGVEFVKALRAKQIDAELLSVYPYCFEVQIVGVHPSTNVELVKVVLKCDFQPTDVEYSNPTVTYITSLKYDGKWWKDATYTPGHPQSQGFANYIRYQHFFHPYDANANELTKSSAKPFKFIEDAIYLLRTTIDSPFNILLTERIKAYDYLTSKILI